MNTYYKNFFEFMHDIILHGKNNNSSISILDHGNYIGFICNNSPRMFSIDIKDLYETLDLLPKEDIEMKRIYISVFQTFQGKSNFCAWLNSSAKQDDLILDKIKEKIELIERISKLKSFQ